MSTYLVTTADGKKYRVKTSDISTQQSVQEPSKVAGLYDKADLATKFIPQFTKGLEQGLPFGEKVVGALGEIPREVSENIPEPVGFKAWLGRNLGQYGVPVAASIGSGVMAEQAVAQLPALAGKTLFPRVARTAIGSAVSAQPFEYDSAKDRAIATGLSAVAGPVFGEAIQVAGKAFGKLGKVLSSKKDLSQAEKSLLQVKSGINQLEGLPTEAQEMASQRKGLGILKKAESSMVGDVKTARQKSIDESVSAFSSERKKLFDQLQSSSSEAVRLAKKKLIDMSSNMTQTYRAGIDQAEDALAARGQTILASDYQREVVDSAIDYAIKNNLPESQGFSVLKRISKALQAGERDTGILDSRGNQIILPNPDEAMGLTDLKNFKNQVYDTISSAVKRGSQYASDDDKIATVFLGNHGKYIGKMVPELAELNAEFAPMAQARNWAMSNFKPFNESEIQKGINILNNLASGKTPNQTSLEYLKTLERGKGRFLGTGSLRGSTAEAGTKLKGMSQESLKQIKKNITDSIDFRIQQIEDSFKTDIGTIKKATDESVEQVRARGMQKVGLTNQKDLLESRIKELEKLKAWRDKIKWGVAVGIGGSGALAGKKVSDFLNR